MKIYFIACNVWLFVALAAYVGKTLERSEPTMYSFFGVGQWFYEGAYGYLIKAPLFLATVCLMMFIASFYKRQSRLIEDARQRKQT